MKRVDLTASDDMKLPLLDFSVPLRGLDDASVLVVDDEFKGAVGVPARRGDVRVNGGVEAAGDDGDEVTKVAGAACSLVRLAFSSNAAATDFWAICSAPSDSLLPEFLRFSDVIGDEGSFGDVVASAPEPDRFRVPGKVGCDGSLMSHGLLFLPTANFHFVFFKATKCVGVCKMHIR
jgi:hypothetical protein